MVEEEGFDESEDVDDELRQLNDDAELSIEELRRRYNFNEPAREAAEATDTGDQPSASSSTRVVSTTTTATRVVKSAIASAVKTSVITTEVVANDDLIEYFPDDDEDDDYVPKQAFFWKKEVRIGDSYQVVSRLGHSIELLSTCRPNRHCQLLDPSRRVPNTHRPSTRSRCGRHNAHLTRRSN